MVIKEIPDPVESAVLLLSFSIGVHSQRLLIHLSQVTSALHGFPWTALLCNLASCRFSKVWLGITFEMDGRSWKETLDVCFHNKSPLSSCDFVLNPFTYSEDDWKGLCLHPWWSHFSVDYGIIIPWFPQFFLHVEYEAEPVSFSFAEYKCVCIVI